MWFLVLLVWFLVWAGGTYWFLFGKPSPFSLESVRPPGPLEMDQKERSKILKQGFRTEKVPENLDAIVIGSGIGGMTAAATLAKLGKRVLVLEQHDQAGGCCHTFTEKGFEFDVGLHYIGQLHENSLFKIVMDQITEGQLQFVELDKHFDTLVIGSGEKIRKYTIYSGKTEMEDHLKAQFPDDTKAVEEFFKIMKISARKTPLLAALKLIPQWMALFLLKSGIADFCSSIFRLVGTDATTLANSLTSNKDLQLIFNYFFYGVPPKQSSSVINALLLHHYKRGRVLVRAPVNRILLDNNGAAYGVTVRKDQEDVEVRAPVIISNCGVFNTFQKLLPPHIQTKPEIQKRLNVMRPGRGCLLVFSGFDATQEELGINSTNTYLFKSNDMDAMMDEYFSLEKDEAPDNIPMMHFTFPSAKDPTSKIRHPGTTSLVFQEVSSPLSNTHYLGSYFGAMYSAEHNLERFQAEALARNRCDTPVKNLFISGQDVFSCGIAGALHGGLLCASTVLKQIVYIDLMMLKKKLKGKKARGTAENVKKLK
ncbi:inactive all-trans-retinol 13,14-reductase-like [Tachysurus ichikawai]